MDPKVLERVRKLLALAQHDNTPKHEAEQAEARAMKLISEHAIDDALLADAGTVAPQKVEARIITLDNPYIRPKQIMLTAIAKTFDCKVIITGTSKTTVYGFPADLDVVDLLFTNLLLQATTEMHRDEPAYTETGAARFSWRRSFLMAFGVRVGQRLEEQHSAAVAEKPGSALVLRSRADQVNNVVADAHPRLRHATARLGNSGGASAGKAAGNRASLSTSRNTIGTRRAIQ